MGKLPTEKEEAKRGKGTRTIAQRNKQETTNNSCSTCMINSKDKKPKITYRYNRPRQKHIKQKQTSHANHIIQHYFSKKDEKTAGKHKTKTTTHGKRKK